MPIYINNLTNKVITRDEAEKLPYEVVNVFPKAKELIDYTSLHLPLSTSKIRTTEAWLEYVQTPHFFWRHFIIKAVRLNSQSTVIPPLNTTTKEGLVEAFKFLCATLIENIKYRDPVKAPDTPVTPRRIRIVTPTAE